MNKKLKKPSWITVLSVLREHVFMAEIVTFKNIFKKMKTKKLMQM